MARSAPSYLAQLAAGPVSFRSARLLVPLERVGSAALAGSGVAQILLSVPVIGAEACTAPSQGLPNHVVVRLYPFCTRTCPGVELQHGAIACARVYLSGNPSVISTPSAGFHEIASIHTVAQQCELRSRRAPLTHSLRRFFRALRSGFLSLFLWSGFLSTSLLTVTRGGRAGLR
jgi:hypothetical protein